MALRYYKTVPVAVENPQYTIWGIVLKCKLYVYTS